MQVDLSVFSDASAGFGSLGELGIAASCAGLRDGFYQMRAPHLGSWFGVLQEFTAGELGLTRIWDEELLCFVEVPADLPSSYASRRS